MQYRSNSPALNNLYQNQPLLGGPQFRPQAPYQQVLVSNRKLQHINCVQQKTEELGGLYLGDIICTIKPQILKQYQIEALVSCLGQQTLQPGLIRSNLTIKMVPAHDTMDYEISQHFEECYEFIQKMRREKKNVLVHCHAGVSRSVTIVCAYLMLRDGISPDQAINIIRSKRQRAKPNPNFWTQLLAFHQTLQKSQLSETQLPNELFLSEQKNDSQITAPSQPMMPIMEKLLKPLFHVNNYNRENRSMLLGSSSHQRLDSFDQRPTTRLGDLVLRQVESPEKIALKQDLILQQNNFYTNNQSSQRKKSRIPWHAKKPSDSQKKTEADSKQTLRFQIIPPSLNNKNESQQQYFKPASSYGRIDNTGYLMSSNNRNPLQRHRNPASMYKSTVIREQYNAPPPYSFTEPRYPHSQMLESSRYMANQWAPQQPQQTFYATVSHWRPN